mgnify:CR=1 FL=1
MNGSLAQRMISYQYRLSKNNELTKTFVENHPNNKSIMEMTEKVDDFFITLREVLLKFLSNLIQDPKFVFSGKNTKITPEQIISDFEQAQKIYNSNDYSEEGWMKIKREACTAELSEETEAQTRMFIQKVEQYQKVLDEFNKKLKYAKLQAEKKE